MQNLAKIEGRKGDEEKGRFYLLRIKTSLHSNFAGLNFIFKEIS